MMLQHSPLDLLASALPFLKNDPLAPHLAWLVSGNSADHGGILAGLSDPDPIRRRVAIASAARLAGAGRQALVDFKLRDLEAVNLAVSNDDADVVAFAESVLRIHEEARAQKRRALE
jgi:predicted outer membrane protein